MRPSAPMSPVPTVESSDSITVSLMRAPPPRMSRRAAPPDSHRPAVCNSAMTGIPASSSLSAASMTGRSAPAAPSSKVRRAVSAAFAAASAP